MMRRSDPVVLGSTRRRRGAGLLVCTLLLAFGAGGPADAVIIDSGDGTGNIEAPPGFPYWANVDQRLGGTSIIYLGDGWVMTAKHVGMGSLLFGDERYEPDPDTAVTFGDPDRPADFILFRMARSKLWPDVQPIEITDRTPAPGDPVLMIGNGRDRGPSHETKRVGHSIVAGWLWGPASTKRWGTNVVAAPYGLIDHGDTSTLAFATRFDSLYEGSATEHEAQAATGDSGGAVFVRRVPDDPTSDWLLAGVMFTVNHPGGGPSQAALYGDYTHAVDLAAYRDEIIEAMRRACRGSAGGGPTGLDGEVARADCPAPTERPDAARAPAPFWLQGLLAVGLGAALIALLARRARR